MNLLLGAPRRAVNLYGFGLGSRTWGWCLPARSLRERTRPSTFPLFVVGRSHPSLRPMRSLASERRPFGDRAFDLCGGRLCRQGLLSRCPTTDVGTALASPSPRRGDSLRKVNGRLRTNSSFAVSLRAPPSHERPTYAVNCSNGGVGSASCAYGGARGLGFNTPSEPPSLNRGRGSSPPSLASLPNPQ